MGVFDDLKVNQSKFEGFISALLNKMEKTKSYIVSDAEMKKNGMDIYSKDKKTAVLCQEYDGEKDDGENFFGLIKEIKKNILKIINSTLPVTKIIIITTVNDNDVMTNYLKHLKIDNNYTFELEYWDWDTVSKYLEKYKKLLENNENEKLNPKKFMTEIPDIKNIQVFGTDEVIAHIDKELSPPKNKPFVLHNYVDSCGKTTLIANYLKQPKYQNKYDHVVWINACDDILSAFFGSLATFFRYNDDLEPNQNFYELYKKLSIVVGNNLLIIDNITETIQYTKISDFIEKLNWKVILISKITIPKCNNYLLPNTTLETAIQIFNFHYKKEYREITVHKILEAINCNPYLAVCFARFLNSNPKLNEADVYELVIEKEKRIPHLKNLISTAVSKEEQQTQKQVLKFMMILYEQSISKLSQEQKSLVYRLSMLSSGEYLIRDIAWLFDLAKNDIDNFGVQLVDLAHDNWIQIIQNKIRIDNLMSKIVLKKIKNNHKELDYIVSKYAKLCADNISDNTIFFKYIHFLEKLLTILTTDDAKYIDILPVIGNFYDRLENKTSHKYYEVFLKIVEENFDYIDCIEKYRTLGEIYVKLKNVKRAIEIFHTVLKMANADRMTYMSYMPFAYQSLALLYSMEEDFDLALEYVEKSIDAFKELPIDSKSQIDFAYQMHEFISSNYKETRATRERENWFNKYFK